MAHLSPAESISKDEFRDLVAGYPAIVAAISESKDAKPGQKTLIELDTYRYDEAIHTFSAGDSPEMTLSHVQKLVEWKLRHGKFRPALMSLVTSNDEKTVKTTIGAAIAAYRENYSLQNASQKALGVLTKLKGIGPATASLLLNVHDPTRVIFFSDEAYWWLCCGGKRDRIRYNAQEYKALCEKATDLGKKLGVEMVDVEKAAYVVMRSAVEGG